MSQPWIRAQQGAKGDGSAAAEFLNGIIIILQHNIQKEDDSFERSHVRFETLKSPTVPQTCLSGICIFFQCHLLAVVDAECLISKGDGYLLPR